MANATAVLQSLQKKFHQFNKRPLWLRLLLYIPLAIASLWAFQILLYSFVNPPVSNLMLTNYIAGKNVKHRWVSLDKISPHLPNAVVMSEDARFCQHWGVDWLAVEQAWEDYEDGGRPRGASTITMQTMKNLFLWPSRSMIRKAFEIPLAHASSIFWSKRRMMEIYLNIAEWGPGVFGAEAASRHHFKKSAKRLTRREAALLAAALPNPFIRRAGRPGPKTSRRATSIEKRMRGAKKWVHCLRK